MAGASGISSILGTISLIGFLVLLGGIGLIITAITQRRSPQSGIAIAIFGLILTISFQIISRGVIVVEPTERAVVFRTLSGELTTPRGPGTHIIIPVLEQVILYSVNVNNYTMSSITSEGDIQGDDAVNARTKDGQEVTMDITVLYRVSNESNDINKLHIKWYDTTIGRPNFKDGFIRPTVRSLTRNVTSRYTAEGIYGENRENLVTDFNESIRESFDSEGLVLENLLLRNVTFSEQFTNAIEQAQVAEQATRRAAIEIRQREQEAQQVRVEAEGQRDAHIAAG